MIKAITALRGADLYARELDLKQRSLDQSDKKLRQAEEALAWKMAERIKTALESRELLAVHAYVGIATHDEWLIQRGLERVAGLGLLHGQADGPVELRGEDGGERGGHRLHGSGHAQHHVLATRSSDDLHSDGKSGIGTGLETTARHRHDRKR